MNAPRETGADVLGMQASRLRTILGGRVRRVRRGRRVAALSATGLLVVGLSGCSDDPVVTPLESAQAQVTAKEKALADAEAEATATAAAFFLVARFLSAGGWRSIFLIEGSAISRTNFRSPVSSNLITICWSVQVMTLPGPNFKCST